MAHLAFAKCCKAGEYSKFWTGESGCSSNITSNAFKHILAHRQERMPNAKFARRQRFCGHVFPILSAVWLTRQPKCPTVVDVSTTIELSSESDIVRCLELRPFLDRVRDVKHLLQPDQLAMRLNVLDELDAIIGDLDPGSPKKCFDSELIARAEALRSQFEAANEMLYEEVRTEITLQGDSPAMDRWLVELANDGDAERPRPSLSFDLLDEIVSGVLPFRGPGEAGLLQSPEMRAYQPTPARHILNLIAACKFSDDDVLVDLGSGLGHVPLLVSILTGIRTLGVEVQPDYAASAQETAQVLNLCRVRFVAEDARVTDLSNGTVFYMFSPFTGSILTEVLCRLREQSKERQIRVCCLGPCTRILQGQTWIRATGRPPDTERVAIFKSR